MGPCGVKAERDRDGLVQKELYDEHEAAARYAMAAAITEALVELSKQRIDPADLLADD